MEGYCSQGIGARKRPCHLCSVSRQALLSGRNQGQVRPDVSGENGLACPVFLWRVFHHGDTEPLRRSSAAVAPDLCPPDFLSMRMYRGLESRIAAGIHFVVLSVSVPPW